MCAWLKRVAQIETGLSNVITLALILPIILYLGYSGIMSAHLADVKGSMETAARVAARDYAGQQNPVHAQTLAYEVVYGSLPVNSGQYNQTVDCQVSDITVNGTKYAKAVVDYRYPVLVPDLSELVGGQAMGSTETVWGTAEFPVGT